MCSHKCLKKLKGYFLVSLKAPIARPILFNFSIKDLFFFVSCASKYKVADDHSLSAIEKTVAELKTKKHFKLEVWFKCKIIVNPEKF